MNRSHFGLWGFELPPKEFARALAALGVLPGSYWRRHWTPDDQESIAKIIFRELDRSKPFGTWTLPPHHREWKHQPPPAHILAEAWKLKGFWPTLELIVGDVEPFWLIEELSRREVAVRAVYVRMDEPASDIGWNWPLQIGFLTDPDSQSLRRTLAATMSSHSWLKPIVEFINLESGYDTCDLLFLPHNLRAATVAILQTDFPVRADCILILDKCIDPPEPSFALLKAIRSQAQTAGVAQVYVPTNDRANWFRRLVQELSHNNTLDISLFQARWLYDEPQRVLRPPVLIAAKRLVEFGYVAQRLFRLADRFERPEMAERKIFLKYSTANPMILEEGTYQLSTIADHIRRRSEEFRLTSEQETATATVNLDRLAESAPETGVTPEPPQPRYIQAEIYDITENKLSLVNDAFNVGTPYRIDVFIAPPVEGAIISDELFHEERLPPSVDGHDLTIVFTEPNLLPEPLVETIFLPRLGSSSRCHFDLRVPNNYEGRLVEARVIVLHQNRVIQTSTLSAPIRREGENVEGKITLSREVTVRTNLDELGEAYRQPFDAAMFFNHGSDGVARGYTIAGKRAAMIPMAEGMEKSVKFFNKKLTKIITNPDAYKKLRSKATTELLTDMAIHGSILYRTIMGARSATDPVAKGKRIQVIAAREGAQLPIEFLYDHVAPTASKVQVCPGGEQALETGKCPQTCTGSSNQNAFVCPLGFWGLSRVIERHIHDPKYIQKMGLSDFALQAEPVKSRRALKIMRFGLLAASKRVDDGMKNGIETVRKALVKATGNNAVLVKTWDEWMSEVKKKSPPLLILLPHTVEHRGTETQMLEISDKQRLILAGLNEAYVRGPKESPPLVLLMGCDTDAPPIGYQSFPINFRKLGAALVISTGATILGQHAAPVTIELLRELTDMVATGTKSFGQIMLEVRRRMLARGYPMTLCLTAYGDTDWVL